MGSNFDDILKKGKEKASDVKTTEDEWKELINTVMKSVHSLNGMYSSNNKHNLRLEQASCVKCSEAMFILAIREHTNPSKVLRFHKGQWKFLGDNKYHCNKCRKD